MKQPSFFTPYIRSLKDPAAEEIIDLVFFRPVGFLFVKFFVLFPVTPNQISLFAMATGIAAGIFLAHGTPCSFMIGGILYGFSNVLDCCDGMLARIKKNGSSTGRIIDGIVDYITGIATYLGLGIGLMHAAHLGFLQLPCNAWIAVAITAASTIIHAVLSDKYRNAYVEQRTPSPKIVVSELERFESELNRLRMERGSSVDTLLIRVYVAYLKLQTGKKTSHKVNSHSSGPVPVSRMKVILWNLIGPSTHITFFVLAAVLCKPMILFFSVALVANVWMILLLIVRYERPAQTLFI